jgi:hypothetical protein
METLNKSFFFVIDKIIELQAFFLKEAWAIGRYVLFIAIASAAINYALTGAGLKENIIKIGKAVVFFVMIMAVYPQIIGFITSWTFEKAQASTYLSIEEYLNTSKTAIADTTYREGSTVKETYAARITKSEKVSEEKDPLRYFTSLLVTREYRGMEYTCVAPAAALEIILLIAGECINYSDQASTFDFGRVIIGLLCGFFASSPASWRCWNILWPSWSICLSPASVLSCSPFLSGRAASLWRKNSSARSWDSLSNCFSAISVSSSCSTVSSPWPGGTPKIPLPAGLTKL